MRRLTIAAAVILAFLYARPAAATEAGARLVDDVFRTVHTNFYDRDRIASVWTDAAHERFREEALAAPDEASDFDAVNRMVSILGSSHNQVIPGDIFRNQLRNELRGEEAPQVGMELELREWDGAPRFFVADLLTGSAADLAGIRRGDEVVAVDGVYPAASPRLFPMGDRGTGGTLRFVFRGDLSLTVAVRTRPDAEPIPVSIEPLPTSRVLAERTSARVIVRAGHRLGYVRLYHLLHPDVIRSLAAALAGPLAGVDGLLIDLRGWGGRPEILYGVLSLLPGGRTPAFQGPVAALMDEETRSAKELAAYHLSLRGIPLVGRRSAGAVLGAQFYPVGDDAVLILAVADVRLFSGGETLEGVGVEPDRYVEDDLPFAAGADAIVEEGTAVLLERLRPASVGPRTF